MSVRTALLKDVCVINPQAPKKLADDLTVSFLPMAAVSEEGHIAFEEKRSFSEVKKGYTYFERDDVLIAKITPCFENGKATRTDLLRTQIGFGSTEFHVLRASADADPNYLFHTVWNSSFRDLGVRNMTGSAGQKRVPADFLKRLIIPLPPLEEQRRIAAILDTADALRRKRKRALDLLDDLTQSIFLEMFGNNKVRKAPIGDLCKLSSGSTPRRDNPGNYSGNIPWIKTGEVDGRVIYRSEEHVTEEGVRAARLRIYPPGTVLVAMYGQGATRGRTAILGVNATINQACAAITAGPDIRSTFLFYQLKGAYEGLRALGRGGNQPNLNGDLIREFEIMVPSLSEQDRFVSAINHISKDLERMQGCAAISATLFASLQSRAFSGQP